ncbi:IS200/IS605 family transposase, partial [Enterococcus sp. OL5]
MTLVSFVRVAYETKKPRVSTRGRNSFSDKKLL